MPISNRRPILRAASTQRDDASPYCRDGKNLTEISAALSIGYMKAANIVPGEAEAAASPALIEFASERKRRPRQRASARLLHHPESWRVLLVEAARAGPKTVEIATSAASRANCGYAAIADAAGIPANVIPVVDAAGSRTKTSARSCDAARIETKTRRIQDTASPRAWSTVYAAGRIADRQASAARSRADMPGADDQRYMSAFRPRTSANAGAGDAPTPGGGNGSLGNGSLGNGSLGISANRGTANQSSRHGQGQSTPHVPLRNAGRPRSFGTGL
jgi:hypothetical protein